MEEVKIKESFFKVKQDITELKEQLYSINQELELLKNYLTPPPSNQQTNRPTNQHTNPTNQQQSFNTYSSFQAQQTQKLPYKPLKTPIFDISTGNKGVPADSQTDSQTDQHIGNKGVNPLKELPVILESIDAIKEEVRIKFKHLTKQEMQVFSLLYTLENQGYLIDYSLLSERLSLTESSIRDYIQRLIKKGIPLLKIKENNKKIFISISPELKKIASLSTIQKLREL
ncbi:MAG: hypothetical protein AABW65_00575 [Nanoarchaeota archaeon]